MVKNKQLIASFVIADENGEQHGQAKQWHLKCPEVINIESRFAKINFDEFRNMKNAHRGRFIMLLNHLEYQTNRLVIKGPGKLPEPLNQKGIHNIMGLKARQGSYYMNEMRKLNAIIKIKRNYYINPKYALRSKGIKSEIIIAMMKFDASIVKVLDKKHYSRLKHFL